MSKIGTVTNFKIIDLGMDYAHYSNGFVVHTKDNEYSIVGIGATLEEAYDDARDAILLNYNPGNLPKFKDSELADQNYEAVQCKSDSEFEFNTIYVHVAIKFSVA